MVDLLSGGNAKKAYKWEVVAKDGKVMNDNTSYFGCLSFLDERITKGHVKKGRLFTRANGYKAIVAELEKEGEGRTLRVTDAEGNDPYAA